MFRRRNSKARHVRLLLQTTSWKAVPMKLLKWGRKKSTTQQYTRVRNEELERRMPIYTDEVIHLGLAFKAKYIGSLEVERPSSRIEIVAAMRRARHEFKTLGVQKRKVTMFVSTDGVRVVTRKKNKSRKSARSLFRRSKNTVNTEPAPPIQLMNHPIYRIFYVSHDSSDLKIFSYIARDGCSDVFKCNVFKSNMKCEAMRIVRSVGQAFDVCHRMQTRKPRSEASTSSVASQPIERTSDATNSKEGVSDCAASDTAGASTSKGLDEIVAVKEEPVRPTHLELLPPPPRKEGKRNSQRNNPAPSINLPDLPECVTKVEVPADTADASTPLSAQHQLLLLRERLEQQAQQTSAVVAQLLLLRDQLAAEQSARIEAQARTHQLLVHNRELLDHIAALVAHLQDREHDSPRPISAQQLTLLPQKEEANESSPNNSTPSGNGNFKQITTEAEIHEVKNAKNSQNVQNNNMNFSPFSVSPVSESAPGPSFATNFGGMTNEQIQNHLISKFQNMGGFANEQSSPPENNNQLFFQNRKAFPNIPPLADFSNSDLIDLLNQNVKDKTDSVDELGELAQAMSVGSLDSSTSKDSSPDDSSFEDGNPPFIMPLSHNGTLRATDGEGRVRIIVPVSPSTSASDVADLPTDPKTSSGATLAVPAPTANRLEAPAAPIIRTTSEKVPNRSEMMTALRAQWTRHTTK